MQQMSVGKLEQTQKGRLVMLINGRFYAVSRAESSVREQKPSRQRLQGKFSCPWEREQNLISSALKHFLVEEEKSLCFSISITGKSQIIRLELLTPVRHQRQRQPRLQVKGVSTFQLMPTDDAGICAILKMVVNQLVKTLFNDWKIVIL